MAEIMPWLRRQLSRGRKRHEPVRETYPFPRLTQLGQNRTDKTRPTFKPVARNLRYFAKTPYARRAINAIKNPIAHLEWEIAPLEGLDLNSELGRQVELLTYCFNNPNEQDSFRSLIEQVVEDILSGAGAIETQVGGDPERPLWLWPVDGLSIQIYAGWDGSPNNARYFQANGYGGLGNLSTAGIPLRNDELIYIRPNPTTADPFGVGPLEIAFLSIARQLGVSEFAGDLTTNARPPIAMHFKGADDGFLQRMAAYWRNEIEGQGKIPFFGADEFEVAKLYPEGDKALYLEWQAFLIREVATAFDLSPQNVGIERDVNRNTSEVAEDRDWDQAIKPMAGLVAEHLTRDAIHRKMGFSQLRFRWKNLDREDELATAQIFDYRWKTNSITPNEIREHFGEDKMDGEWGDMTLADIDIAKAAARGAQQVDDPDLPGNKSQPTKKPKKQE